MKTRYVLRLVTSAEVLPFYSACENLSKLRDAIAKSETDLVLIDTEKFGPALIDRRQIVIIIRGALPA